MAHTQASFINHLPIWGSASRQEADAMTSPYVGPSTMDGNKASVPHPSSTSLSLSPTGRRVAHVSDSQDHVARARSTWERVYSTRVMGFNPDAYGNPMARNRDAATTGKSQIVPHPGWGLPEERPVNQKSSGLSWPSAQSGVAVQGQDGDETDQNDLSEGIASLEVQPTETESRTTTLDINEPDSVVTVPQAPLEKVAIEYPVFDMKAYGDPTRKNPSQTASHNNKRGQVKVSSGIETVQNSWRGPEAASKPEVSPKGVKPVPQLSAPLTHPPSTISHLALDEPKTILQIPDHKTPQFKTSSDQTASSRDVKAEKLKSEPRPATYETLKQGDETPEQMITRLQEEGRRQAMQRVLRKGQGEIPTTTGLALLDLLRKPLPPDLDEPQLNVTNPTIPMQPLSILPDNPEPQSFVGSVRPTNHLVAEIKLEKKEQRKWGLANKNPAIGGHTAPQVEDDLSCDSDQTQAALLHTDPLNEMNRRQTTVGPAIDAVRRNGVAAQSANGSGPSEHYSPAVSDNIRNARPTANTADPRSSKWATAADMKAPRLKPDSNAEGSEETESEVDSSRPMVKGLGRLIRSRKPLVPEERLVGWDGQFLPPPTEWEHRPQFYNNTPEYISGFENWLGEITVRTMSEKSVAELSFGVIPPEEVVNLKNHADGIGFASRETVLGPRNAERYGHRLVKPLVADPQNPVDFDGDAKLDLSDPDNVRYKDETAELLITRRMAQIKRAQKESEEKMRLQQEAEERAQAEALRDQEAAAAAAELQEMHHPTPPPAPTKNIYLRPAVEADAPGMTEILNWHIANGIRPSELAPITEDDMIERLKMSQHARLAFIVAIERTRKTSGTRARKNPRVRPDHPIQNIDPDYIGVSRDEPILGWASATDWSASDYIETTTAELELYVAPGHRKSGVGRCLMDAILEATDRGYNRKATFEFRVAPEMNHMYSCGGGRDLHKLVFQVRSYNKPFTPEHLDRIRRSGMMPAPPAPTTRRNNYGNRAASLPAPQQESPPRDFSKSALLDDREDDYKIWLKEWLESYGFEEEAHLKMMGTKKSRFVDVRYLTRETCWQPNEGRIPDFTYGY